jgi:hypothetical protein
LQLANLFAIDVAAYAVMSNHYHIVVRIDVERAAGWDLKEVLARWTGLFTGSVLVQRYLSPERAQMTEAEIDKREKEGKGARLNFYNFWYLPHIDGLPLHIVQRGRNRAACCFDDRIGSPTLADCAMHSRMNAAGCMRMF